MKEVELRRHTSNEGDLLTPAGVADAIEVGHRLRGGYELAVSSGAQRATQTVACFLAGMGEAVAGGAVVEPALRSDVEDRWREAYARAGKGDLESLRAADPGLVDQDSATLAAGLRAIFERLSEGGVALAVGHSPTNEAAVWGLTGIVIATLAKGEGVVIRQHDNSYSVEAIE